MRRDRRLSVLVLGFVLVASACSPVAAGPGPAGPPAPAKSSVPIYVAVQWHMHQPIYWPGEDLVATSRNPGNTIDVVGVLTWPDRIGAYTHYPVASVQQARDLPHAGAQVSFSGSLIEDLHSLANAGMTYGKDWPAEYRAARGLTTERGNPRLDLIGFGYFHPLMAFLEYDEIRYQLRTHREVLQTTFGGPPSRGVFPPENAFTLSMIPALVDEGFEWILVDNLHMDRACKGYPYTQDQKIPPANPADERNPAQATYVNLHSQTNTSQAVGGVGLRPHWAEWRDPVTGKAVTPGGRPARMLVVPTERSLGYDDSYGDRSPVSRLQELEALNTDPSHPLLIVLAHDGDNFGASGSRYYLETMGWVHQNPQKVVFTTIQDYLDMFPPAATDTIHVEDGSWAGADLGDQTFTKWLGPPYRKNGVVDFERGWSSDWDSWASIVAARNWVATAGALVPEHAALARALRFFHVGLTSCYWYWDGKAEWDTKPTLAANEAVKAAREALGKTWTDTVPPSVFPPQRHPYNPGLSIPGGSAGTRFTVYTLAADAGGLASVVLKTKSHSGREVAPSDTTYAGDWTSVAMKVSPMQGSSALPALSKADRYAAKVEAPRSSVVSYYVEAADAKGNKSRSEVRVVAVGDGTGSGPGSEVAWSPEFPRESDLITVKAPRKAFLHWGVNGWQAPPKALWPPQTQAWPDGKAVETPMTASVGATHVVTLGPVEGHKIESIEFVFHFADGTWGRDMAISVTDPMRAWRARDEPISKKPAAAKGR
ncbi:MAG: hypothetical protein HY814_03395 [Candidatus Riflebacteria bacterium]|nr:hypothetical protein [Candidatus Riflebacteria bacterium]